MAGLELETPRAWHADSYRGLVREFVERGDPLVPFVLAVPNEPFAEFVRKLEAWSRGEEIPPGFVPHSTYFLVRDGEVVGVSNLRHRLTDRLRVEGGNIGYGVRPAARRQGLATELLRLTLDRARELGLAEALLTCARTNLGSIGTIRSNGGTLLSEEFIASRGEVVRRYRIDLAAPRR